jgi:nitrous oxidase accessory protein NosD
MTFNIPINVVKNNIRLPNDKYYGNFTHINIIKENQRLEFRYIGGKDFEKNLDN